MLMLAGQKQEEADLISVTCSSGEHNPIKVVKVNTAEVRGRITGQGVRPLSCFPPNSAAASHDHQKCKNIKSHSSRGNVTLLMKITED
ncbi:hypothetical protein E2C01_082489 [Portunus trituberculatus]|uniref:Uncharacterized protein n=1 Tax=Portunus trituberculatus TaxID=210409 RepID=A0A5B7IZ99_PORTR|nr:hypothetical protein [Portunus trituberculatus]